MRLRLVISRPDLPPTRIVWTTPSSHLPPDQLFAPSSITAAGSYAALSAPRAGSVPASVSAASTTRDGVAVGTPGAGASGYTIAQLLQDVDDVVPLKSRSENACDDDDGQDGAHWHFEDYIVELWGSECLHFMETDALLRDGDEVVIRALQPEELSMRRMTGRDQVAPDGTRLIDGVPFGRPYDRQSTPARPPIAIPPRKRRRIDDSNVGYGGTITAAHLATARQGNQAEEDLGKHPVAAINVDGHPSRDLAGYISTSREQQDSAQQAPPTGEHRHAERDKEADGESKSTSSSSVSSEDESSDTDSSSSDSTSDEATSSPSSSDVSSDSEPDVETRPKSKPSPTKARKKNTPTQTTVSPPGMGNTRTRNSNRRSKLRRRLLRMKNSGLLSKDANFADLRALEAARGENADRIPESEGLQSEFEKKRAQLLRDIEEGGVDVTSSAAKGHIGPGPTTKEKPVSQEIENKRPSQATTTVDVSFGTQAPKRQTKLDTSGARRLLFGSLGIRTPKTKADEERARNKLAAKARPPNEAIKPVLQDTQETQIPDTPGLEPVENWQDYLILRATECIYDNVELSQPPFPFVQRWNDKDQDAIRSCRQNNNTPQQSNNKKRKRKARASAPAAMDRGFSEDEEMNTNGYDDGDMTLDYGEDENTVARKRASKQTQKQTQDESFASRRLPTTDDLPAVPADVASRPLVKESDIDQGAVIAFKQLDLSKATNWQPEVSGFRTAEVEEVLDNAVIRIRLAVRDRVQQETSEDEDEGARIYTKFEMPGYENEDKDDGVREIKFQEMIDPKLLRSSKARRV